jgi:hypothetical protein
MNILVRAAVAAALGLSATLASAQGAPASVEERLQRIEAEQSAMKQQQAELQRQLAERDARIKQLESQLQAGGQAGATAAPTVATAAAAVPAAAQAPRPEPVSGAAVAAPAVSPEATQAARGSPEKKVPAPRIETWGEFDPGNGFLVGRNDLGELDISAYALVRYMDQNDSDKVFTDHLGNVRPVDTRNDIYGHRVMVFFKGWLVDPKLVYNIFLWTVNDTDQNAIFGNLGYQFSRKFSLYAGVAGNPGTRSLLGSHPYWLGHDRVMADEFFRPFFGSGVWAIGEITPGLWYDAMLSNNNSALGVKASQLDRQFTSGASLWWMPTTHEFGPRGGYGDYEYHEDVATRFGISEVFSPEQSFADVNRSPGNTTLRLADSVNLFETGALAPGVTIDTANYQVVSADAGVKYKGMFFQTEYYWRRLNNFVADGALPVKEINDTGFYIQAAFFPIKQLLEVYGVTSQIYGDKDAGFGNSSEYILGMNYYPFHTRNHRLNVQLMDVNKAPVSSTFGYYVGGQDGWTLATSFSVFF